MSLVDQLFALQQVDLETDRLIKQASELRAAIEDDHIVKDLERLVHQEAATIRQHQLRSRTLEGEIESTTEHLKKEERRLYSSNVRDKKGADAVQREIDTAKTQQREQEDLLLVEMEALEEHTNEDRRLRAALAEATATRSHELATWKQQLEGVEAELTALRQKRTEMIAPISQASLLQYEKLRERKGGRAVAQVQGTTCGVCRVTIPTQLLKKAHISAQFCDNCGRILYAGHL